MRLERVYNVNEAMLAIEPDSIGYKIMKDKAQILAFRISNLKLQAMQILKQDALSNGAELVTPRDAVLCEKKCYDCLLFGTPKALKYLVLKMKMQPFGLKALAKDLKIFLHAHKDFGKKIMGIINVDSKSFYKEYSSKDAIEEIYTYKELGIDIIDIGAVSTRPGAESIDFKTEKTRLQPIFDEVKKITDTTTFSIDTYNPEVAHYALDLGFQIVNDVSGNAESMAEILAHYPKASYILTHTQGTPRTMQEHCDYENVILDIDSFFTQKIAYLKKRGCKKIILDVGIGFAKNASQNVALIRQIAHFKHFGFPLLVGASRKSFLTKLLEENRQAQKILESNSDKKAGLAATLLAHYLAWQNGANIVRVHDVREHLEMLYIMESMQVSDIDLL